MRGIVHTKEFAMGLVWRLGQTLWIGSLVVVASADPSLPEGQTQKAAPQKSRAFEFTYEAVISKLPAGKTAKVWVPLPDSTVDQDIVIDKDTMPAGARVGTEGQYGNKILFFEAMPDKDGSIAVSLRYKVTRREVATGDGVFRKPATGEKIERFLEPDKLVPTSGKLLLLVKGAKLDKDQLEIARALYDIVNGHMKYDKTGVGWGRGDAEWACDSKTGNCSDFHSLFIALARSQKIPAKFEMGFPIPKKRGEGKIGGYHCWAWFLPDNKGWVAVDISEANRFVELRDYYFGHLSEDRVQFTTGRDIELVPRQNGAALNFFVDPYVEVDGRPLPAEQIKTSCSYRDL
jgi:hypothetical protein